MMVMVVFMVLPVYRYTSETRIKYDEVELDSGWKVKVHGTRYKNVTLSGFYFDMCNCGDTMTMELKLPDDNIISEALLTFYSVHSVVDMYLDDKLFYTYGHDLYDKNKMLGYGMHYVDLPDDYAGKMLRINDTLGHDMGDALLKRFADMLTEVYSSYGTVGRMGGDEFIVILPEVSYRETEKLIAEMNFVMTKKNAEDSNITLSTAYGFAMSTEVEDDTDAHAAYRLADDRMY